MADYPTTPHQASTPDLTPRTPAHASPDPTHIRELLATLAAIPRDELPDGDDRKCLAQLIRYGFVDNLYTPMGHTHHNIAWAFRLASADPRERIADWLAARRAWEASDGRLSGGRAELAKLDGGDGNEER
jgi:hypothetical protein